MKRRKRHFFGGLITGLFGGVLLTAVVMPLATVSIIKAGNEHVDRKRSTYSQQTESQELMDDATLEKIETLKECIDYYYMDDVDVDDIRNEMLHGMLEGLGDPYSVYYTKEEYDDLQIDTSGVYYGIGAGLTQDIKTMVVTISKVYKGTPAEEAGLMLGDTIVQVDEIEATSMELSKLVQNIRGEEGTTVHLIVYRDGEKLEFDVERRNITLPSVEGQLLDDQIGYIQISEFQSTTAEQFTDIYNDLLSQGMEKVIFDLRGNPGGMLSTVVKMVDFLLPKGRIVYIEDKYGSQEEYNSDASCVDPISTVILIDGNSASASEIFAGAMKDYEYGTLVGTTTFGKGIVQTILPLTDGDAVKITTAKYFTPNGNYIHGVGIEPDVEIEYEYQGPEDSTVYEMQYDNQLQKAIEIMEEME